MSTSGQRPSRVHFWTGIVVGGVIVAALLFSIFWVPRRGVSMGGDSMRVTVVFERAHGLRVGSALAVSGVEAGEVVDVRIADIPELGPRVLVTAEIFDAERFGPWLRSDSEFAVGRGSLLGDAVLDVTPGGAGERLASGTLVTGVAPSDPSKVIDSIERLATRLGDFMDGANPGDPSVRRTLGELEATIANIRAFSERLPQ